MKHIITLLLLLIVAIYSSAQINAYARITDIDASNKVLDIDNVSETFGIFEENSHILIYHTQGNVVDKFSNNNQFGRLGNMGNTGFFEIATVDFIERQNGEPVKLHLTEPLQYTLDLSANANIQVLSYPVYQNYSTTNDIEALPWNGFIGGIVAFEVVGTLTLNHNIIADEAGFRGGATSVNNGDDCDDGTYRSSDNNYGQKGESIYRITNNQYKNAKGAIANGGGGGSNHNGGGGGGSNFTAGGNGGNGWECNKQSGGIGGYSLSSYIANDPMRVFMGGGGGGAQQNNSIGTKGGNGGGIIIINTDDILVKSDNLRISANGESASNTTDNGNDGAGGGGAAGSILIVADTIILDPGFNLNISANGGNGGNVSHPDSHGGGGGGALGVIKAFGFDPYTTPGVNPDTESGIAGLDDNSSNPRESAESGIRGNGVIPYDSKDADPLPVEITSLKVKCTSTGAEITWATASETDNDFFSIEKSEDMLEWKFVSEIAGAYTTNEPQDYQFHDTNIKNETTTYYRIKQTDIDGSFVYLDVLSILCKLDNQELSIVGVNATSNGVNVYVKTNGFEQITAILTDMSGKTLSTQTINDPIEGANLIQFNTDVNQGIYIATFIQNNERVSRKIYIE
jgi:hypothetical protein